MADKTKEKKVKIYSVKIMSVYKYGSQSDSSVFICFPPIDISSEVDCVQAIHDMLPLSQDNISLLVDLVRLILLHHAILRRSPMRIQFL